MVYLFKFVLLMEGRVINVLNVCMLIVILVILLIMLSFTEVIKGFFVINVILVWIICDS